MIRALVCLILMSALSQSVVYAQQDTGTSANIVTIDSRSYYVHTVQAGETVYSIARSYGVKQEDVLAGNPLAEAGIKPGQALKIPVPPQELTKNMTRAERRKENRLFDTYTVNNGETAYGITKRFGISVNTLIEDNPGLDPARLQPGQMLRIRKSAQGQVSGEEIKDQWEDYTEAINKVSDEYLYHFVRQGETVYSISREFNVPQNLIMRNNDLGDGLRAGTTIKIPLAAIPGHEGGQKKEEAAAPDTVRRWATTVDVSGQGGRDMYNVAMLLPISVDGRNDRSYLEFYQGALLALESLKAEGVGVRLDLFNTGRSDREIEEIVQSPAFSMADLIIGPVYEKDIAPVVMFAAEKHIPVVSPLVKLEYSYGPFVYQMSPIPETKYDKMKGLLSPDNNVVVITSGSADREFASEIERVLPVNHSRLAYGAGITAKQIESAISSSRENVFVILSDDQYDVDKILAMLSSIQASRITRSQSIAPIRVIGTPRWTRFNNNDKDLYFKLRVCYVTSYYAGRENDAVVRFDSHYVKQFGSLPTQFSYRGYDAVKLFVSGLSKGGNLTGRLNGGGIQLLEIPYRFRRESIDGNTVNDQWAMVCFNNDYTISLY